MSRRVTASVVLAALAACGQPAESGTDGSSSPDDETTAASTSMPMPPPDLGTSASTTSDGDADETTSGEACPNLLADGGFEEGWRSTAWYTDSTLFGTPRCNPACREGATNEAHEGRWWLWFGGTELGESAHALQVLRVPAGQASLSFQLRIPEAAGTGDDLLVVLVDGDSTLWIWDTDAARYGEYVPVTMDLREIADGGEHEIGFAANFPGTGVTSFYVDTVRVTPCAPDREPEVPDALTPRTRPSDPTAGS